GLTSLDRVDRAGTPVGLYRDGGTGGVCLVGDRNVDRGVSGHAPWCGLGREREIRQGRQFEAHVLLHVAGGVLGLHVHVPGLIAELHRERFVIGGEHVVLLTAGIGIRPVGPDGTRDTGTGLGVG